MDFMSFFVSKEIAKCSGPLSDDDASRVALIGAIRPFTPLTVLLVQAIARRQGPFLGRPAE
jgi:hypothetical protein